MSRYTYAGPFQNPTDRFYVKAVGDHFEIYIREDRASDGSAPPDRPHKGGMKFPEAGDAAEWLEDERQGFEEDYDDYLEENRFEISQMERLEAFERER